MERKTILAIVLSALVYFGFYFYTTSVNSKKVIDKPQSTELVSDIENIEEEVSISSNNFEAVDENEILDVNFKTDFFDVTFNTKGANISSLKLLNFKEADNDKYVDIVNQSYNDNALFDISLGDYNDAVYNGIFSYKVLDKYTYEFSKVLTVKDAQGNESAPFTIVKTYKFLPNDYMFELKISIKNSENSLIPINSNGTVYALNLGKQIGPEFEKLSGNQVYRRATYNNNEKRKILKTKKQEVKYSEGFKWAAVESKFFAVAIVPENSDNNYLHFTDKPEDKKAITQLTVNRKSISSSFIEDTYKIYVGPKDNKILKTYNNSEKNGWNIEDSKLNTIVKFRLHPLAMFFMTILENMNKVIKNYGISIILFTIIIKIVLYPFTKKSIASMGKMQTVQPEIKKLQDKYKDDSAKLNAAMADLYKKEGINPLGGCLPMLLQMPIFIAFYSLFSEYIGLRGSSFIPGWIDDLSKPEYIIQFGSELPILNWGALRLLPIIYLASQLISLKFTQNKQAGAHGASAMQTKMLTLGMPIMLFFVFYNYSSGLLVYWITQSIISSVQQILSKRKSDKEHEAVLEEKSNKKKKKRK